MTPKKKKTRCFTRISCWCLLAIWHFSIVMQPQFGFRQGGVSITQFSKKEAQISRVSKQLGFICFSTAVSCGLLAWVLLMQNLQSASSKWTPAYLGMVTDLLITSWSSQLTACLRLKFNVRSKIFHTVLSLVVSIPQILYRIRENYWFKITLNSDCWKEEGRKNFFLVTFVS